MAAITRLQQIGSFCRLARSPWELLKLGVLGYARGHTFGGSGWASRLGRHFFPTMVIRPKGLGRTRIELDLTDLGHLISFDEVLVQQTYDLDRVPFEPDVIIDCGAHIGLFSLIAAHRFPRARIIAFEPHPQNAAFLRRQIARNRLPILLIEAAVCLRTGTQGFFEDLSNSGSLRDEHLPECECHTVATVNLREFIQNEVRGNLLLKLDVEGEEVRLMPRIADVLPTTCAVFFEVHGGPAARTTVHQPLEQSGFAVQTTRMREPFSEGFALRTTVEEQRRIVPSGNGTQSHTHLAKANGVASS